MSGLSSFHRQSNRPDSIQIRHHHRRLPYYYHQYCFLLLPPSIPLTQSAPAETTVVEGGSPPRLRAASLLLLAIAALRDQPDTEFDSFLLVPLGVAARRFGIFRKLVGKQIFT